MMAVNPSAGARPLVDEPARRRIVEEIDRSFCVEAAAGTGKTTLLVGRILKVLESGRVRASQLAAITFTELAAAQLKSRLREQLQQSSRPEHRRALEELESARISTIHSMALAILKERAVEAGLDPGFETVDPAAAAELFDELWRTWLGQQAGTSGDGPGSPMLRLALGCGLSVADLKDAAMKLYEHRDVALQEGGGAGRVSGFVAEARQQAADAAAACRVGVERLRRLVEAGCKDGADKLAAAVHGAAAFVAGRPAPPLSAGSAAEFDDLRRALEWGRALRDELRRLMKGSSPERLGAQKNWRGRAELDEARAAFRELVEGAESVHAAAGHAVAHLLRDWLREFVWWAQQEKKRRGVADFLDQLLWCRDLLRDDLAVRGHFQQRFRAVFVDEFQDTDPLQAEIVFYLAEQKAEAREWRNAAVGPGRLFIVGDPKQSIYRFRRADVEMYREAAELLAGQGSKETIRQNFRTVPSIVRAVNAFFAPWMGGAGAASALQPAYVPLDAYRDDGQPAPGAPAPGAYRLLPSEPPGQLLADEARELEARLIAWALRELVGSGRLQVEERGAWRPSRWSDAVVLMPVFTGIEHLEAALEAAQVPYRVVGGRLFYVRPEIRDLTLLASAVANPSDRLALLGALRSGFFGISDAELAAFAEAGGTLDGAAPLPEAAREAAPAVARAMERVLGWHAAVKRLRPSEAMRQILDESGYRALLLLAPNGRQALANVEKLLAQAAAFEEAGPLSFGEFARWLRRRGPGGAAQAEEEDSPLAGDDDVVRVMTVHKAKGLEFPIVFLANLGERRDDAGSAVVDRAGGRVELRIGPAEAGIETAGYRDAAELERQRLQAERVRLYYVAATRARDYLFLSALPQEKGFWKELQEAAGSDVIESIPVLQPDAVAVQALQEAAAAAADPTAGTQAGEPGDLAQEAEEWERRRKARLDRAAQGLRILPAGKMGRGTPEAAQREVLLAPTGEWALEEAGGDGGSPDEAAAAHYDGTALGLAFHQVMERAAARRFEVDRAWIEAQAAAAASRWKLPAELRAAVAAWAEQACRGPIGSEARSAVRYMVEVPFVYRQDDGSLVEGRIDLVCIAPDGRVRVIDYKTDGKSPEELRAAYGAQAFAYAEAVRRALGGAGSVEVWLYAARAGTLVPVQDRLASG